MIAFARAISHGSAYTNYSTRKKDSVYIGNLNLDGDMTLSVNDDMDFAWDEFRDEKFKYKAHGKEVKNTLLAFEVSPARDESVGWTTDDWREYAMELLQRIDAIKLKNKEGKVSAPKTDLLHSKAIIMLHTDSRSGIRHLHIMASRFTIDGRLNSANLIGQKAVIAANQINKERGWKQPQEISEEHKKDMKDACYEVLRNMKIWDIHLYFKALEAKGYRTEARYSADNEVSSYWIFWGNSKYTASEIGDKLTAKKIQKEWKKLHPLPVDVKRTSPSKPARTTAYISPRALQAMAKPTSTIDASWWDSSSNSRRYLPVTIPQRVYDFFDCEARDVSATGASGREYIVAAEDVMMTAAMLFVGYIEAATHYAESAGGGGGGPTGGWGRDKDDDEEWARCCLAQAEKMCCPKIKKALKRGR